MSGGSQELAGRVVRRCAELGFARAGVCPLAPTEWENELRAWIGAGKAGEMDWLDETLDARLDPDSVLEGARSAIMVADLYVARGDGAQDDGEPGIGRVARYARGRDYHEVIKRRLHMLCDELREEFEGHEFRAFVDTAPVLERELAMRAGIGWVGKHTLLIDPAIGSYFVLGGVLTTMELEPPPTQRRVADHCGTCTRCIDACPTDAITPYSVDARRCISYLTIEHRTMIDEEFREPIGGWVFGCDICQEVCPHNGARPGATDSPVEPNRAYAPRRTGFDLLDVLGWDEDARRRAFETSSMKRATLEMMKRNALIVAGNALRKHELPELRARIEQIAKSGDEPAMVRDTASIVLRSLDGGA